MFVLFCMPSASIAELSLVSDLLCMTPTTKFEYRKFEYKRVKRWSKKVPGKDIFKLDKIFFPINQGNMHWVCAVAYMQEKRIQFYDSMGAQGKHYLNHVFNYIKEEHQDKKKAPLPDMDEWKLVGCTSDTPRQGNGTW